MPFVSVTRLRLKSPLLQIPFVYYSVRSMLQIRRAPGNLAWRTLKDANLAFWTLTAWRDEASMRAFMVSGAHKHAMKKFLDWCDEGSIAHWTQDSDKLPDWESAWQRMVNEGRPSKVRTPSAAHLAGEIPKPKVR
jgi:hypothetical protein